MADWRCPHCDGVLTRGDFAGPGVHTCPNCGGDFEHPVDAEAVEASASVVGARPRSSRPGGAPYHESGGGEFRGRTIYMRLDNARDGSGCFGCGCLVIVIILALALRGCATLF